MYYYLVKRNFGYNVQLFEGVNKREKSLAEFKESKL